MLFLTRGPSPAGTTRNVRGAAVAVLAAAVVAALLVPTDAAARPAAASPAPSFHAATPTTAPPPAAAVTPVVNGARRADYVKPLSATAAAGGLALSQSTIADYWYWASGIGVAGTLSPYAHAVLQDVSPSGRVLTYPAVRADANGAFSVLAKYDLFEVEDGAHLLRLTDDFGNVRTATLDVTPFPGRTLEVTVTPSTMTRAALYDHGVTITVTGLVPHSLAHIVVFTPWGAAYEIGPLGFLPSDDDGTVTTVLDVSTGVLGTGTWEASVLDQAQTLSGYTTFTVTGPRPQADRQLRLAATVTQTAFAAGTGEAFLARGFAPFEIVQVDLTTTTGQIAFIGRYRANGVGALSSGVVGNNAPLGRYRITVTSVRTGEYATATFTVTDAVGNSPAPPVVATNGPVTRLTAMDPAKGLRFTGTGFQPGATVYLTVTSTDSVRMVMNDRSRTAVPADSRGRVAFRVNPLDVPAAGTYDVTLDSYAGGPYTLRTTVTITR